MQGHTALPTQSSRGWPLCLICVWTRVPRNISVGRLLNPPGPQDPHLYQGDNGCVCPPESGGLRNPRCEPQSRICSRDVVDVWGTLLFFPELKMISCFPPWFVVCVWVTSSPRLDKRTLELPSSRPAGALPVHLPPEKPLGALSSLAWVRAGLPLLPPPSW